MVTDALVDLRRKKYPGSADLMVADGGYLSWVFGTRDHPTSAWRGARALFTRHAGTIMALDFNGPTWRQNYMAGYKQRRRDMREADPLMMEKRDGVARFIAENWTGDDGLEMIAVPGLEADDLVVMFSLWLTDLADVGSESFPVVGIDKDFLQSPYLTAYKHSGYRLKITDYAERLPSSLARWIRKPSDVLLCLVLLGDKSDSIPRILPKGRYWLNWLADLVACEPYPFQTAADRLGLEIVAQNLYVTVLPSPYIFQLPPEPHEVLAMVDRGEWWYHAAQTTLWSPKLFRPLSNAIHSVLE